MTSFTIPFSYPDHGVLTVFTQGNDGAHTWRNTIDIAWDPTVGPPGPTDAVISAFVGWVQNFTRDDATVIKHALTPWSKGNLPFSEQGNIWEQVDSLACKNWGTGNALPLDTDSGTIPIGEICASMLKGKFGPGGGKPGRLFMRNCISSGAVTADAGGPPVLTTEAAAVPTDWNNYTTDRLGDFCTDSSLPRYVLVHASKTSDTTYDVFDTAMAVPVFERLTTHNLTKKHKK